MLNYWKNFERYHNFIKDEWNNLNVEGWKVYVLKEKLKMIKGKLKEWHKSHTQNLDEKSKLKKKNSKSLI